MRCLLMKESSTFTGVRKPKTVLVPKNCIPTVKNGRGNVMTSFGVSRLDFVEGNLDCYQNKNILERRHLLMA